MLVKVTSLDEILQKVSGKMKKSVFSNNFITKEIYETEIKNGTLFYYEYENSLFIFREREKHYILNFHIIDEKVADFSFIYKDIVTEIPYKTQGINTGFLENKGFTPILNRERFTWIKEDIETGDTKNIKEDIDKAKIAAFLANNFSYLTGCLPKIEEVENALCYVKDDEILAILHYKNTKAATEIRHLATAESGRNKGIASKLIQALQGKDCRKILVWTNNAGNLYLKHGFNKDIMKSITLERKK